ncbi:Myosin type-2 heavy chain 1, partial [Rhizopus stolonifer]
ESRLPAGTDQGFCQKLYDNFSTPDYKNYFKKPRFSNAAFTVAHYAHDVQYEAENFLEKNKDSLPDEHLQLLQNSEFTFLPDILAKSTEAANAVAAVDNKRKSMIARKPTLGSIFKNSLISLMDTIGETNVHYIRCIKPNEAKVAWEFEAPMVLSQLRACGVLETIRISCLGYPSRWTFEEFADRYYALVSSKHWDPKVNPNVRDLCQTKIFFRAGQLAYLEKLRSDRFNDCATVLQKNIRRFVYRHRYMRMRELAIRLQAVARKQVAQKALRKLQEEKAAIVIQKEFRRFAARREFLAKKEFAVKIQKVVRARNARHKHKELLENHAAVQIQRCVRGMLARKWYKTQIQHIVYLQSCVRRHAARKELLTLKAEARSASHFKEVSYKLENKVVELTQTITILKTEKSELASKAAHFESQMSLWTEKHNKLEQGAKSIEAELRENSVPRAEFEAIQQENQTLKTERTEALEKVTNLTTQVEQLQQELKSQKETIVILESRNIEAAPVNNEEMTDLKAQIVALKAQLAKAMHTRQGTLSPGSQNKSRSISPANIRKPISRPVEEIEEANYVKALPQTNKLTNRKIRRNSSAEVTSSLPKSSIDQLRRAETYGKSKNPRPTSVGILNTLAGGKSNRLDIISDNPEEEINAILRQADPLQEEVFEGLIKSLKLPLPSEKNPPSQKEVVFPAHIINMCINDMWRIGYNRESESMLFGVMDTIQKQCLSFTGEDAIIPCAFWLTNVHELLSLIVQSEQRLEYEMQERGHSIGWREFEKLMQTIKFEMQCLEDNIFHAWMKEIKRKYSKMVIPAVIESQSLPGFITNDSGRFLNKLLLGSTGPAFSMDDLLSFLNKIYRTMTCYFMEPSVMNQVLIEVLKMTGVTAFNDLLMRKNFSSWKRAMQIQYNTTRIEEWCKGHNIPEGTLQLEHLMQATKLLQFKKATLEDIENIYDVCWILSPTQIQKLISQYYVADYENPIQPEILRAVASRVVNGDKDDVLLLDSIPMDDTTTIYEVPSPRETKSYLYLPAWLNLKRIRRLILLENALASREADAKQEDLSITSEPKAILTT